MFCGFYSIVETANGNYNYSAWLIFVAALFDALDGIVARLTGSSSELGVELDSLSDIVSFGAAPAFILYKTYFIQFDVFGIILASLPMIAGGFRLARFNVQLVGFEKSFFIGLPIPSAALTIASYILAFHNNGFESPYDQLVIPLVLLVSVLMISNIRYETLPKFSFEGIKEKPFHFLFLLLSLIAIILFYKQGIFYTFVFMIAIGIFRHIYYVLEKKSDSE
jgi:CDP-diacylglycerol--serine O-phosphatidyltransferase